MSRALIPPVEHTGFVPHCPHGATSHTGLPVLGCELTPAQCHPQHFQGHVVPMGVGQSWKQSQTLSLERPPRHEVQPSTMASSSQVPITRCCSHRGQGQCDFGDRERARGTLRTGKEPGGLCPFSELPGTVTPPLPCQPMPMPDHTFREEIFQISSLNLPRKLEAVQTFLCPVSPRREAWKAQCSHISLRELSHTKTKMSPEDLNSFQELLFFFSLKKCFAC